MKITAQTYNSDTQTWSSVEYDAWRDFGLTLSDGLDSLRAPLEMKEPVTNQSRLEHGTRVAYGSPKVMQRSHTLSVTIIGVGNDRHASFETRKNAFLTMLYGSHRLVFDFGGGETYTLTYSGKGCSYSGKTGTFCAMTLKFDEYQPNPHLP